MKNFIFIYHNERNNIILVYMICLWCNIYFFEITNTSTLSIGMNCLNNLSIFMICFRSMVAKPLKASDIKWWYKPTRDDKANIAPKSGCFKVSWDGVFHTIQWEWQFAWIPTTFVRLHFCNLQCSWCDARYTRKSDTKEYWTEPTDIPIWALYKQIERAQQDKWIEWYVIWNVTFTWWEPLLQQKQIIEFMKMYPDFFVQIETNWTIMPDKFLLEKASFNCSPKLENSKNQFKRRYVENVVREIANVDWSCFKFVCETKEDIDEVTKTYLPIIPRHKIRIMPEWVTVEENRKVMDKIIDYILSCWYNVALRWQNVMRDWAKRGV